MKKAFLFLIAMIFVSTSIAFSQVNTVKTVDKKQVAKPVELKKSNHVIESKDVKKVEKNNLEQGSKPSVSGSEISTSNDNSVHRLDVEKSRKFNEERLKSGEISKEEYDATNSRINEIEKNDKETR